MVITTLRFKDKKQLEYYQEKAKDKYNLDFSKYVRMLINEDLKGEVKNKQIIEEENRIIEQLRIENEILKKEMLVLKENILLTMELNTNRILQKLERGKNTIDSEDSERILDLLNEKIKGKKIKISLKEISEKIGLPEHVTVRILDSLIEKEVVKLFSNMKYGRID